MRWIARLLLIAALAPITGRATAQEEAGDARRSPEAQREALGARIEEFLRNQEGAVFLGSKEPAPPLTELRKTLAELQVHLDTTADGTTVERGLLQLWMQASSVHAFEGQAEFLAEVVLARSRLLERQGETERARMVLQDPLIPEKLEAIRVHRQKLAELPRPEALNLYRRVLANEQLQQRFERLSARRDHATDNTLAQLVQRAHENGDYSTIRQIGPPAFDLLAEIVLAEPEAFYSSVKNDPLWSLMSIDLKRAGIVVRDAIGAGSYLWKRRIIRCIAEFVNTNRLPDGPWFTVFGELARTPDTFAQIVTMLDAYGWATNRELTPQLAEAILPGVVAADHELALETLRAFWHPTRNIGSEPSSAKTSLMVAALEHAHPDVRALAAEALALSARRDPSYARNEALLRRYDDPSVGVRLAVCRMISATPEGSTLSELERTALGALLEDTERVVQDEAAATLLVILPLGTGDLLDQVVQRSDAETCHTLAATSNVVEPARQGALLSRLASHPSAEVTHAVDQALEQAARTERMQQAPDAYLPAVLTRLRSGRATFNRYHVIGRTREARDAHEIGIVATALRDPELTQAIHSWWPIEVYDRLDEATLVRLLELLYGEDSEMSLWNGWVQRPELLRGLIRANEFERLSLMAGQLLAGLGKREDLPLLLELFTELTSPESLPMVSEVVAGLPDALRNEFLLQVVERADERVAIVACQHISRSGPHAAALAGWVLERWPLEDGWATLRHALRVQGSLGEQADAAALERGVRTPYVAKAALTAIQELRDPRFTELLGDCLIADWLPMDSSSDQVARRAFQQQASGALSMLLTDEAAEQLLRGLSAPDSSVREACLAGLEHIEVARREMERVRNARSPRPTRESALEDLAALLEHPDPARRVMAIDGIVSFGALEYLPTLINRIDREGGQVRDALLAAIDRLTENGVAPKQDDEAPADDAGN